MTVDERLGDDVVADVIANAGDAVIVADAAGAIRFWSPGAEAMFGHSRAAALGQSLDIIIPEALRERHWEGFNHTMATGQTQYVGRTLAVPALRADGTRISIEFTVAPLPGKGQGLRGVGAIVRDVTERWERDRALRRRVTELERELAELRR